MTKKERFLTYCKNRYRGVGTLAVMIKIEGQEHCEYILNKSVLQKLSYYENAYDDDLVLKNFSGVRIVGYAIIENDLQELKDLKMQ